MKKIKTNTAKFSPKDAYLIWQTICNVGTRVPHRLKALFFGMMTDYDRNKFRKHLGEYVVEKYKIYLD